MEQLDLSDFFKTKSQAHDFSLRLGGVSESIYETSFDLEKSLLKQFGVKKKDKFIAFLRDNNIKYESNAELKIILTKIQEKIATLPVITLTVAIEPDEQIIQSLSDWLFLNLKKQILFDIEVDPCLIAGTNIRYGGKYVDYSLKPVFDEVLKGDVAKMVSKNGEIDYTKYNATPLS